jgi:pimeloyl-ACP methyl ester carboxylesterase
VKGEEATLTLPDGRRLELWASRGTSTSALLVHYGTPCAGVPYAPMIQSAISRGCRFVTYSRPGYAGSTRRPGRSVSDCVEDVVELTRALGLEQLHVVGWSGGGPHALACAALLPELVASAATLAGVAPWEAEALDWLEGMAAENHEEFGAALAGEEQLTRFLEPFADELGGATAETITEMLGGLVTEVDSRALTGEFAAWQALAFRRAVASGIWGWHDDDIAFTRDWGFAPADVTVPVTVWQGRRDAMVPYAHGVWLAAHLPRARAMLFEEEGHLSLVARFDDVVEDLLASG